MIAPKNTLLPFLGLLLALFFHPVLAVRGDACGKYACGSATWTWASKSSIKDISVSVKDTDCDGKYVYIYLKYQYVSNLGTLAANVLRYENRSGCSGGYKVKNTPTFKAGRTIRNIRVFVCRSDALSDTCYSSGYYKNPKV